MSCLKLFGGTLDCIHRSLFWDENPGIFLSTTSEPIYTVSGSKIAACYHITQDCFYLSLPHMELLLSGVACPQLRRTLIISIALHESRHRAQIYGKVRHMLHPGYCLPPALQKEVWRRARSGRSTSVAYELDAYTLQYLFHQVVLHGKPRTTSELVRLAACMACLDTRGTLYRFKSLQSAQ